MDTTAARAFNGSLLFKIALSVLFFLLFCLAVFGRDSLFDSFFEPIDKKAESYLETTLTKTAITYGTIRGIHAVIAIFKGTQVHPPFVTIALGEALDPVQDLIQRFSDVLVLAIASLGAQRFLMEIGQMVGAAIFVGLGAALAIAGVWIARARELLMIWGARLIVFGFAVRLIIPLMAYGADLTSSAFLAKQYEEAEMQIDIDKSAITESMLPTNTDQGFVDKIKSWTSTDTITKQFEAFKLRAENLAKSLVTLFTLFVFQTLIFPLFSLWLLVKLFTGFLPNRIG